MHRHTELHWTSCVLLAKKKSQNVWCTRNTVLVTSAPPAAPRGLCFIHWLSGKKEPNVTRVKKMYIYPYLTIPNYTPEPKHATLWLDFGPRARVDVALYGATVVKHWRQWDLQVLVVPFWPTHTHMLPANPMAYEIVQQTLGYCYTIFRHTHLMSSQSSPWFIFVESHVLVLKSNQHALI
jgi:hypothetical protein